MLKYKKRGRGGGQGNDNIIKGFWNNDQGRYQRREESKVP